MKCSPYKRRVGMNEWACLYSFSSVLQIPSIVVTQSTLQAAQRQHNAAQTPQLFATLNMFPIYSRSNYHTGGRSACQNHSSTGIHDPHKQVHAYSKLLHFRSPRNDRPHRDNLEERSKCRHYSYYFYRTHDRKDQT